MDPWPLIVVAVALVVALVVLAARRRDSEHAKQVRHARRWQKIEAERMRH